MLVISSHFGCEVGSQTVGETGLTLQQAIRPCQGLRYTVLICRVGDRGSQGNCSEPQA